MRSSATPYDVFISYGHRDKLVANAACARLESRGIRCWIAPRDLVAGQSYGEGIATALHNCRALVLIFSASANVSPHVNNEVERAVNNGIPIVPVRIEDVSPTGALEYFIGSVHWLDALTEPLDRHLERLADDIERLMGVKHETEPPGREKPAPRPQPRSKFGLYASIGALGFLLLAIVVVGLVLHFRGRISASSVKPVASTQLNGPRQPARPTHSFPRPPKPLQRMKSAGAAGSLPVAEGIAGCWQYNGVEVHMLADGRVTGSLEGAHWNHDGGNHYSITWPKFVDTLSLSAGGQSLNGTDNYGLPVAAQRISGQPSGFPGIWRWINGLVVTASDNGNVVAGPLHGKWVALSSGMYRINWTHFPVDQLVMSADGRTLSGQNQYGGKVGGIRVTCSN